MRNYLSFSAALYAAFALCCLCGSARSVRAEDAGGGFYPGARPPLTPLHWWEDFGFLKDPAQQIDTFDPIKYVPLDCAGDKYFTLGLEQRERYESWSNSAFGQGPVKDPNGYFETRTLLRGDLRLKPFVRIYTELISAYQTGRRGDIRAFDQNALDVTALFVEVGTNLGEGKRIDFRIGRQEMHYGLGRLIEIQDTLNQRQSFDEAKMMLNLGSWQVDAFYARPVVNRVGVFDDKSSEHYDLSGIYAATRSLPFLKSAGLDCYWLRNDTDKALFFKGIQNEHRNTLGVRLHGNFKNFHYDVEQNYQFGQFGPNGISAWASSNEIQYTFAKVPTAPWINLHFDAFSGDRGAGDKDLGTFNSLFPRGQYFSEPSPIGKQNLVDLRPSIGFNPHKNVTLSAANIWYWRQTVRDGTYFFNGFPMVPPISRKRYIGMETALNLEWRAHKNLTFNTAYSRFYGGEFVQRAPHGGDFHYLASWFTFRF